MGTHVYIYAGELNKTDETNKGKAIKCLTVGARMFTLESRLLGFNLNTHKGLICFTAGLLDSRIMMNESVKWVCTLVRQSAMLIVWHLCQRNNHA